MQWHWGAAAYAGKMGINTGWGILPPVSIPIFLTIKKAAEPYFTMNFCATPILPCS